MLPAGKALPQREYLPRIVERVQEIRTAKRVGFVARRPLVAGLPQRGHKLSSELVPPWRAKEFAEKPLASLKPV